MMWLKIMPRITATRGIVKIGLPPARSDHGFISESLSAAASAARKSAAFLSNDATSAAVSVAIGSRYGSLPSGATSELSAFNVVAPQLHGRNVYSKASHIERFLVWLVLELVGGHA